MNHAQTSWRRFLMAGFLGLIPLAHLDACTDVLMKTDEHQVVSGRNMDYPLVFDSKVLITPTGRKFQSKADPGYTGLSWVSRFGYVGITGGRAYLNDGMNERGLSIAEQTLGITRFPDEMKEKPNLEIDLFCDWVLGNYSSIDEMENALKTINIFSPAKHTPVHYALHDGDGNSAVIEFIQGGMRFSRNENGVLTNDPSLDWQETNLKYFKWENSMYHSSVAVPGNYFSVERFIRATLTRDALPAAGTPQMAVANALVVLGSVTQPHGMLGTYTRRKPNEEKIQYDSTLWTVIRDHLHLIYYYKSFDSPSLKAIDLKAIDLSGKTHYRPIPVGSGDWSVPAPLQPR
jgi:choloylglycine hydrolase